MSVFDSVSVTPVVLRTDRPLFLARYRGRALESYRADLRQFFQWASDLGLPPLAATRRTSSCTGRRWMSVDRPRRR